MIPLITLTASEKSAIIEQLASRLYSRKPSAQITTDVADIYVQGYCTELGFEITTTECINDDSEVVDIVESDLEYIEREVAKKIA